MDSANSFVFNVFYYYLFYFIFFTARLKNSCSILKFDFASLTRYCNATMELIYSLLCPRTFLNVNVIIHIPTKYCLFMCCDCSWRHPSSNMFTIKNKTELERHGVMN